MTCPSYLVLRNFKGIMSKQKAFGIIGSSILLLVAVIHGFGTEYVTGLINSSNLNAFIKEIFPVVFIHPSIHLIGIAILGFYSLSLGASGSRIFKILGLLIAFDSGMAFYLKELAPALILLSAAICLFMAGVVSKKTN